MSEITIIPLTSGHAAAAAELHIEGQPGTFLTALGPTFLTVLYRQLAISPSGFGFAAVNTSDQVVGFVSATTDIGAFFKDIWHYGHQLVIPLITRFLTRPGLIIRAFETLRYPGQTGRDTRAELLSIMVRRECRGQSIGTRLLEALIAECRARGLREIAVTVDAANEGANRFYQNRGFRHHREFRLYCRTMNSYILEIQS